MNTHNCINCGEELESGAGCLCRWCFEEAMRQHWEHEKPERNWWPLLGLTIVLVVGGGFWALVAWVIGVI